jgi:hypothetical protein
MCVCVCTVLCMRFGSSQCHTPTRCSVGSRHAAAAADIYSVMQGYQGVRLMPKAHPQSLSDLGKKKKAPSATDTSKGFYARMI